MDYTEDMTGKHAWLAGLEPERSDDFRPDCLFLCESGFGCSPNSRGSTVFARSLMYPERGLQRYCRSDFSRLATDDEVEKVNEVYQSRGLQPLRDRVENGEEVLKVSTSRLLYVVAVEGEGYTLSAYGVTDYMAGWECEVLASHHELRKVIDALNEALNAKTL